MAESWATRQAHANTHDRKINIALSADPGDASEMNHVATSMIHAALTPLYHSGRMSDLTVTCGGRTFRVHKAIVCSQSRFFDAACNGGFIEAAQNKINLPEDDPETLDRFFQFLYSGNYSDGEHFHDLPSSIALMTPQKFSESVAAPEKSDTEYWPVKGDHLEYDSDSNEADNPEEEMADGLLDEAEAAASQTPPYVDVDPLATLAISLRVYSMADKYQVPTLKQLAKRRFAMTAENRRWAYDDFPEVVDDLWENTPPNDPLREFVCKLIQEDYQTNANIRIKMRALMEKHSDLAVVMLDSVIDGFDGRKVYKTSFQHLPHPQNS